VGKQLSSSPPSTEQNSTTPKTHLWISITTGLHKLVVLKPPGEGKVRNRL